MEQEIREKGRFQFVADFVVRMTRTRDNRSLVSGYQVRRRDGRYTIFYNGHDCGYGWMTAEQINAWLARLPLSYFAMQAEQMVTEVLYQF